MGKRRRDQDNHRGDNRRPPHTKKSSVKPLGHGPRFVFGVNTVRELVLTNPTRIIRFVLQERRNRKLGFIEDAAAALGKPLDIVTADELRELVGHGLRHQGVAAEVMPFRYHELNELIDRALETRPDPLVLVLDQITDEGNLGNLLRSAAFFGIDGIVLPRYDSAEVTPQVEKASAGTAGRVPVTKVVNVAKALDTMKERGFWAVTTDVDEGAPLAELQRDRPMAIILGSEGKGVRPLVRASADMTIHLPGNAESLNVGSFGAVIMYHLATTAATK